MLKRVIPSMLTAFLVLGLTVIVPLHHSNAQDNPKEKEKEEEKVESREAGERGLILKKLRLYDPVPVFGPYPALLYGANVGDLVQLQVSYPINGIFPRSVSVRYFPRYFRFVDIVETDGKVVTVPPTAEGGIGVGYYSIFLKPTRAGTTHVDVIVEFENGDSVEVPFHFRIGNERKLMSRKS